MIVYDVTSERSFANVKQWLHEINRYSGENVAKVLVGNKCDQIDRKEVNYTTGKQLADDLGISFTESSAKSGTNINHLFLHFAQQLLSDKAKNTINDKNVQIKENNTAKLEKKQKSLSLCAC